MKKKTCRLTREKVKAIKTIEKDEGLSFASVVRRLTDIGLIEYTSVESSLPTPYYTRNHRRESEDREEANLYEFC